MDLRELASVLVRLQEAGYEEARAEVRIVPGIGHSVRLVGLHKEVQYEVDIGLDRGNVALFDADKAAVVEAERKLKDRLRWERE